MDSNQARLCPSKMMGIKRENNYTEEETSHASLSMNNNKKRRANHMDPSGNTISLESYKKLASDLLDDNRRLDARIKDLKGRAANLLEDNKRLDVLNEDLNARIARQEQGEVQENDDDDDLSSDDDEEELGKKNDPWSIKYDELRQYVVKHGNCMVPRGYKQNHSLATWVNNQRAQYRNLQINKKGGSKISQERIEKLDSIGFYWGKDYSSGVCRSFGDSFDDNVSALQEYKAAMGNFDVHPNQELGRWIVRIRAEYKLFIKGRTSLLTIQHIQKLKDIGFSWKKQRRATGVAKCLSV